MTILPMSEEKKTKLIQFRISPTEKEEVKITAKKQGFDQIGAFFMFLYRKFGNKN